MQPFEDKKWLPSNGIICLSTSKCEGHNAGDLTFWKSTVKDTKTGAFKTVHLTNEEVRHAVTPATGAHSVPYIYAHFKWSHCDETGVEFPKVE